MILIGKWLLLWIHPLEANPLLSIDLIAYNTILPLHLLITSASPIF